MVQAAALANPSRHGAGRTLRRGGRPIRLGAIHDGLGRPVWNNLPKSPQAHCHAPGDYLADLRGGLVVGFQKTFPHGGQDHRTVPCHHRGGGDDRSARGQCHQARRPVTR